MAVKWPAQSGVPPSTWALHGADGNIKKELINNAEDEFMLNIWMDFHLENSPMHTEEY